MFVQQGQVVYTYSLPKKKSITTVWTYIKVCYLKVY